MMRNMYPLKNTDEALIYQGRVTAVYPATMTVDIYVPEINNQYSGVYILSNSIQTTYGTVSMPEVNSVGLLVLYHRSKQPVVMGFIPPYKFNSGEQKFEYLNPGECQTSAKGGGFFKADIAGNAAIGNAEAAADMYLADGEKLSVFLGESEISNFHKNDLHIDYNSDIITIGKSFRYQKSIDLKSISESDVYRNNTLNREVIESVLKDAENTIGELADDNSLFSLTRNIMKGMVEHTVVKSDIDEYVERLNGYILPSSGVSVEGEIFKDNILSVKVKNDDGLIAGFEIDELGARKVGRWNA